MTKREIFKQFTNLSQEELNTKNDKKSDARNDVMTTIIKCRGEKTRGIRAIDGFRKKLMIPDSESPKCSEFEAKSKIGKIFKNIIPLKILLGFMKLILIFINITKKKYKLIKMGVNIYYLELMFIFVNFY